MPLITVLFLTTGLVRRRPPLRLRIRQGREPARTSIGANDLLAVSVYAAPELTRTVRVSGRGWLRLPMLQQRILRADSCLPTLRTKSRRR